MKATEINLDNNPRQAAIGPGERLQAARIQQGLSLNDVAHRMHLSIDILKAIEDNNFEEITAPIFVKGYLRAYARIVSLNEDEMILQYRDFYSEEDPPISSTSNILPELSAGDARIRWTTYLVILVIAVLLAAWWWNKEESSEAPISLDSQSTEQLATEDAQVISSEIEAVSEELADTAPVTEAAPEQDESVEPVVVEPVAVTESPTPVTIEPAAAESAAPASVEPAAAESAVIEPESPQPATESIQTTAIARGEPIRLAPSGSDKMQLVVIADTWTDVKDANNYQLVYDLLRAGDTVELTGEAPFTVFLGNGHGIEINYNDEAVDISGRIRDDNTARLKVGS